MIINIIGLQIHSFIPKFCTMMVILALVSASAKDLFYYLANQHLAKMYEMYFQANLDPGSSTVMVSSLYLCI